MFLVSKVQQPVDAEFYIDISAFCWSTLVYFNLSLIIYVFFFLTAHNPNSLRHCSDQLRILLPWQQSARLHSQHYLDINPVKRSYSEEDAAMKTAVYPHLYQNRVKFRVSNNHIKMWKCASVALLRCENTLIAINNYLLSFFS